MSFRVSNDNDVDTSTKQGS